MLPDFTTRKRMVDIHCVTKTEDFVNNITSIQTMFTTKVYFLSIYMNFYNSSGFSRPNRHRPWWNCLAKRRS